MILQNGKRIDGCSDTVPVGTLQPYLGLVPPKGYLVCQGQLVSKITYSKLYEICGDMFGDGTETEFRLPDLRGKTIAGYDENDTAMNSIGKLLGQKTHTHTSTAHTHTVAGHTHTSAAHTHTTGNHTLTADEIPHIEFTVPHIAGTEDTRSISTGGVWSEGNSYTEGMANDSLGKTIKRFRYAFGGSGTHNHGNTGSTTPGNTGSTSLTSDSTTPGATGSNSNYQPTITMNWIIKAVMLIPEYFIVENTLNSNSTENALSAAQGKALNDKFVDYATKSEMIQYLPLSGVINALTSTSTTNALSAAQGKKLNDKFSNYLPLGGGTLTGQITRNGKASSWIAARDNALICQNTLIDYSPIMSTKTNNGSWSLAAYDNWGYYDKLIFSYISDTNYNNSDNTYSCNINFTADGYVEANGYKINSTPIADHVIEYGTSGMWSYRKWSSGTAECWGITSKITGIACNKAWGVVYESSNLGSYVTNYPFTFASIPAATVEIVGNEMAYMSIERSYGNASHIGNIFFTRPSASDSVGDLQITVYAIGKWK